MSFENHPLRAYTPEQAAAILRCDASWLEEKARNREFAHLDYEGVIRFGRKHLTMILLGVGHAAAIEPSVPERFRAWAGEWDSPGEPSLDDAFAEGFAQAMEWLFGA